MATNMEFSDLFIGIVLETDVLTRRLGIYIPKLMPAISESSSYSSEISTNSNNAFIEGVKYNTTLKVKNTIWAAPWNVDFKLPKPGSKVIIYFIDDSPKSVYWFPFNSNGDYEVLDEEKYAKVINLKVGNSNIEVFEEDSVNLNLPSNFSTTYFDSADKQKEINIEYRENYIVSEFVPSNPFDGMLWYNPSSSVINLYTNNQFKRVVLEPDISSLEKEVGSLTKMFSDLTLSGRIIFVQNITNVRNPENDDIVGIDSVRANTGYYSYKLIDTDEIWEEITSDGIYWLRYANRLVEIRSGIEEDLVAYKYNLERAEWEIMDGWFNWTVVPSNLTPSIDMTSTPLPLDENKEYIVYSIKLLNPTLDPGATVQFKTLDDNDVPVNIGLSFKYDGTSFTTLLGTDESTIFQNISVVSSGGNLTIIVPDIGLSGINCYDNIYCEITNPGTTSLGTVTITGKYKPVEEEI
jgi:hypothetical protein